METLVDDNNRNGALFSNEKLRQAANSKVMKEIEAELECRNEITMDTSFQYPLQKKDISTIIDSGYNYPDDQLGKISDSKEHIDASSRLSTNSAK